MHRSRLNVALLAAAVSACTATAPPRASDVPPRAEIAFYYLQSGDEIAVQHVPDLDYNMTARIAPDGTITVPGLPEPVLAQGETVETLKARLVRLYQGSGLITHPVLAVSVREFASQQAFIGGEVRRPGLLNLPAGVRTVMQALVAGGGPLATADIGQVAVVRTYADGHVRMLRVDLRRVMDGSDLAQNIAVQPLDVVIVPASGVASLDVWVDQYIRQAAPIPARVLLDAVFRTFRRF